MIDCRLFVVQGCDQIFHLLAAIDAFEGFLGPEKGRRAPAQDHLRTAPFLTRRVQLAATEKQFSIMFVLERLWPRIWLIPSFCSVSVSSRPSAKLRAAIGLKPLNQRLTLCSSCSASLASWWAQAARSRQAAWAFFSSGR